jgi:hypothetical protein
VPETRPWVFAAYSPVRTPKHWTKRTALLLFQDRNEALKKAVFTQLENTKPLRGAGALEQRVMFFYV